MPASPLLRRSLILIAVLAGLYLVGITPRDLWGMGKDYWASFMDSSRELSADQERHEVAGALRQQAEKVGQMEGVVPGDSEAQKDLQAARRQVLEDRANALEQHKDAILRGDTESMKRQVAENARKSAGNY
ncbi:MAG: hypothetical protein ACOZCK_06145 [Pseudomonadota bacterium]